MRSSPLVGGFRPRSSSKPVASRAKPCGMSAVERAGIIAAEEVIRPFIRTTPVVELAGSDVRLDRLDAPITLKLELLQQSGSFKARGALANLLLREVPHAGVVAASGGNHGAA